MNDIQEFYDKTPYPNSRNVSLNQVICLAAPMRTTNETILSVGCGINEAALIGIGNKDSKIIGIDVSENQIKIAKSVARHHQLKNVSLHNKDITTSITPKCDRIIANGVLHHIRDVQSALLNISLSIKENGIFTGFVYSRQRPSFIKELNHYFIKEKFSLAEINDHLRNIKDAQVRYWLDQYSSAPEDVSDTWLNPYFVEYDSNTLAQIISSRFKYVLISNDLLDVHKLFFMASNVHPVDSPQLVRQYHPAFLQILNDNNCTDMVSAFSSMWVN